MDKILSFALIKESLCVERYALPEPLNWLQKSYLESIDFWHALKKTKDMDTGITTSSIPFTRYNFFNDMFNSMGKTSRPAVIWLDGFHQIHEISYRQLARMAGELAFSWQQSGVIAGHKICIVKPFGTSYIIDLLAALKCGAVVSFLPPSGKTIIKQCLNSLVPDHISTEEIYLPLLAGWEKCIVSSAVLPGNSSGRLLDRSHTYRSGDRVALCFDFSCENFSIPKEITADLLYLCAMRDGLIALGLKPGDIFAAPDFHPLTAQPACVLSVFFAGATYLHLTLKNIETDRSLLVDYPIKVLGVTGTLRDLLMAPPVITDIKWKFWFREPSDVSDFQTWDKFIKILELEDVFSGCMKWNAAMGGCLLFSYGRKGQSLQNLLPSAGIKWQLAIPENETSASMTGYGLFAVDIFPGKGQDEFYPTACLMMDTYLEKMFIGTECPCKKGLYYPKEMIIDIVQYIPFCSLCVVIDSPQPGTATAKYFNLVIFTGTRHPVDHGDLIKKIRVNIINEAGKAYLPDHIVFFPYNPRRLQSGEVDAPWCSFQYVSGGLTRKTNDEIFMCLSRLRDQVYA